MTIEQTRLPMACICTRARSLKEDGVEDYGPQAAAEYIAEHYPKAAGLTMNEMLFDLTGWRGYYTIEFFGDQWFGALMKRGIEYDEGDAEVDVCIEGDTPELCLAALYQWAQDHRHQKED